MTEKENKAVEALNQDLPKYALSDGTRRYIAMSLAKKGYRRAEEVRIETIKEVVEWYEDHQVCVGCEQMNREAREHFGMEVIK